MNELECIKLKMEGARYVESLVSALTFQEQLEFWQKRTDAMLDRQRLIRRKEALQEV